MRTSYKFTQSFLSPLMLLILVVSTLSPPAAHAQGSGGVKRQVNAQTGKLSFLLPETGSVLPAREALNGISRADREADPAMALAKRFGAEFGLADPEQELTEIQQRQREDGRLTVRYQQTYQGIPVIGGELIVRTNREGDLYSINGEVSAGLDLATAPSIPPEQAQGSALQAVAKWYQKTTADFTVSEPALWILDPSLLMPSSRPRELVWRMEVTSVDLRLPVRELVLVNARRGNISLHFNQIDTAWNAHTSAQVNAAPGPEKNVDMSEAAVLTADVATYTAGNGTSLPGSFLCAEARLNCTNGADLHADKAHTYAIGTYNLFATQHGRDSFDNAGGQLISTVHYDVEYQNAFWSGTQMVYGDGYGFPLADDVVAHELAHGVTQHESNLFYFYQSGAINESFSDLWGEFYDQTNSQGNDGAAVAWQIGEDISGLGAIRDMREPPLFDQPDKMSSALYAQDVFDNGGVHINSGINNKAVYLLVHGGAFNGKTVSALGWAKTAAIYYEVNTDLLTSGADYADLYFAIQAACSSLIGQKGITPANCADVKDAIEAVEMQTQPVPGFNTDAPYCDTGEPSFIFSDGIESGIGNWTFNNGSQLRWQVDSSDGPYARSGNHSLFADDIPEEITDARARLKALQIPGNAYLHFAHAFQFESFFFFGEFDGGVLEYSLDGGTSWLDAGSLIDFNGYNGTVAIGGGNPIEGRAAFVSSSHGYISTRLNLVSLAGKTVTFRWRMGLDLIGSGSFLESPSGWWVDDVRLYTCGALPGAFDKTTPANGSTGVGLSPTLSWEPSSGATSYEYCYDTTNDNVCSPWTSNDTSTSKVLSGLNEGTTYYWHARARNSEGTRYSNGGAAAFWSFKTRGPTERMIFTAVDDGWVLESSELSGTGGTMNGTAATLVVGDNAADRQYRAILAFNTAGLPDDAVITRVRFRIKHHSVTGMNPLSTHGNLLMDIIKGAFSGSNALQLTDFQAAASKNAIASLPNTPSATWYSKYLRALAYEYINKSGMTQIRLRFRLDDNDDLSADLLRLYSGNATAAYRPRLIVEYYIP